MTFCNTKLSDEPGVKHQAEQNRRSDQHLHAVSKFAVIWKKNLKYRKYINIFFLQQHGDEKDEVVIVRIKIKGILHP